MANRGERVLCFNVPHDLAYRVLELPSAAIRVYLVLGCHLPKVYPSFRRIAELARVTKRSAISAVQALVKAGLVEVEVKKGFPNVYTLVGVPASPVVKFATAGGEIRDTKVVKSATALHAVKKNKKGREQGKEEELLHKKLRTPKYQQLSMERLNGQEIRK
jgi:hypothetical protein